MHRLISRLIALTLLLVAGTPFMQGQTADTLFVQTSDETFDAFPRRLLLDQQIDAAGTLTLTLADSAEITYTKDDYVALATTGPALPRLTSFKFNNKFNDEMPYDAEPLLGAQPADGGDTGPGLPGTLTFSVASITKWLTPSFKTDTEGAEVYVGDERQESKVSRHRFDEDIIYSTSLSGCRLARMGADGTCRMGHYGHDYNVSVEFLTESAGDVPRIEIDIDGRVSRGQSSMGTPYYYYNSKTTFARAAFRLYGNGVYEDMEDSVWIKGRGNSSWSWPKKPYRLKFDTKVKPFGLTAGKNWVLLSNYQSNSMMANAIGMKAARLAGTKAANHIIPVDLYVNGSYAGSYNFTEKVGTGNNSIDIDEENGGVLLELDQYYDEPKRFYSDIFYLPVNVKAPDLTEEPFKATATERFNAIKKDFNAFSQALDKQLGYEYKMDVDAFARFLMVNDLILNFEIGHPKSTFVYNEHVGEVESSWVFGPVWDLDWAYGYENYHDYYVGSASTPLFSKDTSFGNGTRFFRALLQNSERTKKAYYRVWYYFMQDSYQELIDYIQDYFDYASPSFQNNAQLWWDGYYYEYYLSDIRTWLDRRTTWIMNNIEVFDLSQPEPQPVDAIQDVFENPDECIVVGGDVLTILAPVPQHIDIVGANGIRVLSLDVEAGTTTVPLEPGIYIVNQKKILIK